MQTPYGQDCRHYYQDFHRGRDIQECRLIKQNPDSLRWKPTDCKDCPVPGILHANASPDLELRITVETRFLGLGRQLTVEAFCTRHQISIDDAHVGCQRCNEEKGDGLGLFRQALDGSDD
jgi:hypothetical protein